MGLRFSASKTSLLFACGYPFRDDVDVPESSTSPAAERGDRVHKALDGGPSVPPGEQGYVDAGESWLARYADHGIRKELGVWWAPVSDKRGELYEKDRDYSKAPPGSVVGTVDVILTTPHGFIVVADYKTSELSAKAALNQLRTLSVLTNADEYMSVELRPNGQHEEHLHEIFEPWDKLDHANKLRLAIAKVPTSEPTPGDHCSDCYCPLRGACPAYQDAAKSIAAELVPDVPAFDLVRRKITDPIASEGDAAQALMFIDLIEDWADRKKREAREWAEQNSGAVIQLPNGQSYKRIKQTRTSVSANDALALAEKHGATEDELAACVKPTSFDVWKRVGKAKKSA